MKVLYVLPRYHTNMLATIEGWIDHGDEVYMICQLKGTIEADEFVEPYYAGFSKLFLVWQWIHMNIIHRKNPYARDLFIRYGIPPMNKIKRVINDINPDLIIIRERSFYTIMIYSYCRRKHYKCLLYTQAPEYVVNDDTQNDLRHRIVKRLTPPVRITPSRQRGITMQNKRKDSNSFFAPFVVKPVLSPGEKQYFRSGRINILDVGKYEERKNHLMLINVFERLLPIVPDIHLTIVGEVADEYEERCFNEVVEKVHNDQLEEKVTLLTNYTKKQVDDLYVNTDLFVLPSTAEVAAVSNVEAMAYSIPVISGTDNGTADYTVPGVTGDVFEDCNEEDLYNKMLAILQDRKNIITMGAASYERMRSNYQFKNYYDAIMAACAADA